LYFVYRFKSAKCFDRLPSVGWFLKNFRSFLIFKIDVDSLFRSVPEIFIQVSLPHRHRLLEIAQVLIFGRLELVYELG